MNVSNLTKGVPPRSIDLNPEDWLWVTYRERTPLARPEPRPFNREEALARLAKVKSKGWPAAQIAVSLSLKEARFWFTAMTTGGTSLTNELARPSFGGRVTLGKVRARLAVAFRLIKPEIMLPVSNLLHLEELCDLIADDDKIPLAPITEALARKWAPRVLKEKAEDERDRLMDTLAVGFRAYVLPYLTQAEIMRLRPRLRPSLHPSRWPTDYRAISPAGFHLAAGLGMHEETHALVRSWPDDFYGRCTDWDYSRHRPQEIIFGLGSAELVESEMRRLKLRLYSSTYIRAWLAHTQYAALDVVRDSILAAANRQDAERLLETFTIVHAPEAAPQTLALMLSSRAPQVARRWLDDHPEHAIAGLIPVAAERGRLAGAALNSLRRMKRQGYEALIRACLEQAPVGAAGKVRAKVLDVEEVIYVPFDNDTTPDWLREALPDEKRVASDKAKKPAWVDRAVLPPVAAGKHCLNDTQVAGLLYVLQQGTLDQPPPPLVTSLKAYANRDALDTFAWEVFEQWLYGGAPSKGKWALIAVGWFGSDASALRLAQFIRAWPGEGQHKRAVLGLECLRAIGTDTALMQINSIAQKVRFKGIKAKASEAMEAIARNRNMTREELEDRIVPDCDLDERGSRVFDFGPRQFRFVLSPDMKPKVRDEKGKLRANLPKPGVKDDASLASQAIADWKLLKKQVRQVAQIQALRLEQVMVTGRRWSVDEFEMLLVHHPLMVNLVRMLLWGGYDASGQLVATFRVTEDQTYADVEDEECSLAGIDAVGILHPLHLSDELKAAWGELLSDYEIVSPFQQLGREIYHLEDEELEAQEITRFADVKVPAISLVSTLERLGWVRGIGEDHGYFCEHSRPFYGANVTAVVQYEPGVWVGGIAEEKDQRMERCFFVSGIYTPVVYNPRHENRLPLGEVAPLAISETLKDLSMVAAKAK